MHIVAFIVAVDSHRPILKLSLSPKSFVKIVQGMRPSGTCILRNLVFKIPRKIVSNGPRSHPSADESKIWLGGVDSK